MTMTYHGWDWFDFNNKLLPSSSESNFKQVYHNRNSEVFNSANLKQQIDYESKVENFEGIETGFPLKC